MDNHPFPKAWRESDHYNPDGSLKEKEMDMYEKLQRAHGTLMTVNDRSDFDLEPTCRLLREAAEEIRRLEDTVAILGREVDALQQRPRRFRVMVTPCDGSESFIVTPNVIMMDSSGNLMKVWTEDCKYKDDTETMELLYGDQDT